MGDEDWAAGLVGETLLDRYLVEEIMGSGGMGVVLGARHLRLERAVAIKMMHPSIASDHTLIERFHQEARAAASVDTEGVVDILDLDVDPQRGPFLVMERLNGHSLVDELKTGRLSTERALWIATELLDVLEAVHRRGIVHRDLKPPNVFLQLDETGDERVKVLDFGIAKVRRSRLTATGQIVGTPRFMAPEQARGDEVDARADVYAAGLLLYCCLTGEPPFAQVSGAQVLEYVLEGLPSVGSVRPDLDGSLVACIDKAIAPDPDRRFDSAGAFANRLRYGDAAAPRSAASDTMRRASAHAPREEPQSDHPGELPTRGGFGIAALVLGAAAIGAGAWMMATQDAPLRAHFEVEGDCSAPNGEVDFRLEGRDLVFWNEQAELVVGPPDGGSSSIALQDPRSFAGVAPVGAVPGGVEASSAPSIRFRRVRLEGEAGVCFLSGSVEGE